MTVSEIHAARVTVNSGLQNARAPRLVRMIRVTAADTMRVSKESFNDQPPADGAWIIRDSQLEHIKNGNEYYYMSYY